MNMVKKFERSRSRKSRHGSPTLIGERIYLLLAKMGGNAERGKLASLWRNWAEAVGDDLAWTAPGGHRGDILLLWAEDSMEMQEISLLSPEILLRVNAWLKSEYFARVKINLRSQQP